MVFLATKAALAATLFGIGVTFGALNYLQKQSQENNGGVGVLGQSRSFELPFPSKQPLPTYVATVYLPQQSANNNNNGGIFRLFGNPTPSDCDCKVVHECSSFSGASSASFRLRRTCGFQGFQRKICCDEPPPLFFSTPHPQLALDEMKTAHAQLNPSNCNHNHNADGSNCNCDDHNSNEENSSGGSEPISKNPSTESMSSISSEGSPSTTTEGKAETLGIKPADVNDYFRDDLKTTTPNLLKDIAVLIEDEMDTISRSGSPFQDDQDQHAEPSTENSVESTTAQVPKKKVTVTLENVTFPALSEYFPDELASDISNRFAVTTETPAQTELSIRSSTASASQSTGSETSPSPLVAVVEETAPEAKAIEQSIPDVTETIVHGSLKGTSVPQSLEFVKNEVTGNTTENPIEKNTDPPVSRRPFALGADAKIKQAKEAVIPADEDATTQKDSTTIEFTTLTTPKKDGSGTTGKSIVNLNDMHDEDMSADKFYPRPTSRASELKTSNESTMAHTEVPESMTTTTSRDILIPDADITTTAIPGFSARSANAQSQEPATIVQTDSTTSVPTILSSTPKTLDRTRESVNATKEDAKSESMSTTITKSAVGITEGTLNIVELLTSTVPPTTTTKASDQVTAKSAVTLASNVTSKTGQPETKISDGTSLLPETTVFPNTEPFSMNDDVGMTTVVNPDLVFANTGDMTKTQVPETTTTIPSSKIPEVVGRIEIATDIIKLETTTTSNTDSSQTTTEKAKSVSALGPVMNKEMPATTISPTGGRNETDPQTTPATNITKKNNKTSEGESTTILPDAKDVSTSKMKTSTLEMDPKDMAVTEAGDTSSNTETPPDPLFKGPIKKKPKKPRTTTISPEDEDPMVVTVIEYDDALDDLMMKFDHEPEPNTQVESQSTPKPASVLVSEDIHLEFSPTTTEREVNDDDTDMTDSSSPLPLLDDENANEDMGMTTTTMSPLDSVEGGADEPITEITKSIRREPDTDKTIVELSSMFSKRKSKVTKVVTAVRSGSEASVRELTTESPLSTTTDGSAMDLYSDTTTENENVPKTTSEREMIEMTSTEGSIKEEEIVFRKESNSNASHDDVTERIDEIEMEQPQMTTEGVSSTSNGTESSPEVIMDSVDLNDEEVLKQATTTRAEIPLERLDDSAEEAEMSSTKLPLVDFTTENENTLSIDSNNLALVDVTNKRDSTEIMLEDITTEEVNPNLVDLNDEEIGNITYGTTARSTSLTNKTLIEEAIKARTEIFEDSTSQMEEHEMLPTEIPSMDSTTENGNSNEADSDEVEDENSSQVMIEATTTEQVNPNLVKLNDEEISSTDFETTAKSVSLTNATLIEIAVKTRIDKPSESFGGDSAMEMKGKEMSTTKLPEMDFTTENGISDTTDSGKSMLRDDENDIISTQTMLEATAMRQDNPNLADTELNNEEIDDVIVGTTTENVLLTNETLMGRSVQTRIEIPSETLGEDSVMETEEQEMSSSSTTNPSVDFSSDSRISMMSDVSGPTSSDIENDEKSTQIMLEATTTERVDPDSVGINDEEIGNFGTTEKSGSVISDSLVGSTTTTNVDLPQTSLADDSAMEMEGKEMSSTEIPSVDFTTESAITIMSDSKKTTELDEKNSNNLTQIMLEKTSTEQVDMNSVELNDEEIANITFGTTVKSVSLTNETLLGRADLDDFKEENATFSPFEIESSTVTSIENVKTDSSTGTNMESMSKLESEESKEESEKFDELATTEQPGALSDMSTSSPTSSSEYSMNDSMSEEVTTEIPISGRSSVTDNSISEIPLLSESTTIHQAIEEETSSKSKLIDETTPSSLAELKNEETTEAPSTIFRSLNQEDLEQSKNFIPDENNVETTPLTVGSTELVMNEEVTAHDMSEMIQRTIQPTGQSETTTVSNAPNEKDSSLSTVTDIDLKTEASTEIPSSMFRSLNPEELEQSTRMKDFFQEENDTETTPFTITATSTEGVVAENDMPETTTTMKSTGHSETITTNVHPKVDDVDQETSTMVEIGLSTTEIVPDQTMPTPHSLQIQSETVIKNITSVAVEMEDKVISTTEYVLDQSTPHSLLETTQVEDRSETDSKRDHSDMVEIDQTTPATEEREMTTSSTFSNDLKSNSTSNSGDDSASSTYLQDIYDTLFGPSGRSARVNNLGDAKNDNQNFTKTTTTPEPPFKVEVKVGPYDARALFSSDTTDQEKQLEDEISNVVGQLLLTTHKNFHLLPNFVECAGARGRTGRRKTKVLQFDTDNYPWMARVGYREPGGVLFPCAGTIITHRYILTSAHCATRKDTRDATVMEVLLEGAKNAAAGMSDQSQYKFKVEEIMVHPNYNKISRENDIALIRLARDIPSFNGSSDVKPICLPFEDGYGVWDSLPGVGDTAYLGGWGYGLKNMAATVEEMEEAAVTIWSNENCTHLYRGDKEKKITSHHICAYGKAEKDACRGDAGGPLMALMTRQKIFFQVGVVSYGPRCGYGVPGVYTKVRDYLMWLLDSMHP